MSSIRTFKQQDKGSTATTSSSALPRLQTGGGAASEHNGIETVGPGGAPGWIWCDKRVIQHEPPLSSFAVHVYMVLAYHVRKDRTCFPSQTTIARISGISRSRTNAAIRELVKAGFVATAVHGRVLVYALPQVRPVVQDDRSEDKPVAVDDRSEDEPVANNDRSEDNLSLITTGCVGPVVQDDTTCRPGRQVPVVNSDTEQEVINKEVNNKTSPSAEGEGVATAKKAKSRKAEVLPEGFSWWYEHYPRKVARSDAVKAWDKLAPDDALQKVMIQAVEKQKRSPAWLKDNGDFIPHPATWINGRRWEDQGIVLPNSPPSMEEIIAKQRQDAEQEAREREALRLARERRMANQPPVVPAADPGIDF